MYGPMSALAPDNGTTIPITIGPESSASSEPSSPCPQADTARDTAPRTMPNVSFCIRVFPSEAVEWRCAKVTDYL